MTTQEFRELYEKTLQEAKPDYQTIFQELEDLKAFVDFSIKNHSSDKQPGASVPTEAMEDIKIEIQKIIDKYNN